MNILYFSWVRERIGQAEETIHPPETVRTVSDLMTFLAQRGQNYAAAFKDSHLIRAAINQRHVKHDTPLGAAREVAFFPPMTGG